MPSTLRREIGKKSPFDLPEQEAHLNIVRTAGVLETGAAAVFRRQGLSASSYNVLRILRGAGPGGKRSTQIGDDMVVRVPDVTRLVDRLVAIGLVSRQRSSDDRRAVIVAITRKGTAVLSKLDKPVLDLHKSQLGHLSKQELAQLNRLLVKARSAGRA